MPIVPLFGHDTLRARLLPRIRSGRLPQSLLLHGPVGVGKQRLALWIAQALLCDAPEAPCGRCRHCRYLLELQHPDLGWIFPRPRDPDADVDDVAADLADARRERAEAGGLYAAPPSEEGIFVTMVRHLVQQAARTPGLARRKVLVVGDADRMAPQEGQEFAANAFLKLLEEPPPDTWIVVTTSAIGSLLPTVRSRVVAIRVPRVDESGMRAFLGEPSVAAALDALEVPAAIEDRLRIAQGAPGVLLSSRARGDATARAARFLKEALSGDRSTRFALALAQGHSGARGQFSDVLDALTLALYERLRRETQAASAAAPGAHGGSSAGTSAQPLAITAAIDLVEDAKRLAEANVSPQLISATLLSELGARLARA